MPRSSSSILGAALLAGGLASSSPLTAEAPARLYLTFVSHNEDSHAVVNSAGVLRMLPAR